MTDPLPLPPSVAEIDPARLADLVTLACADEQAAYASWIAGELVICMCGDPLTRSGRIGRRQDLDPTDPEPEGMWIHQGGYYAGHPERPLLIADLAPPCTPYKPVTERPAPDLWTSPRIVDHGPVIGLQPSRPGLWARLIRRLRRG